MKNQKLNSLLALSLLLPKILAKDPNQVILVPQSDTVATTETIDNTPEALESSNVYVSGDLLCNGKECYPLVFEPSSEWQIIKPEQRLPGGLDIKMNLETGVKEAKLGDESSNNAAVAVPEDNREVPETGVDLTTTNYEFSEQFVSIREALDKDDLKKIETEFDGIMEFAHDYSYGLKIVAHEFPLLQSISLNTTLPLSLREIDSRFILGCMRNNPPVLEYINIHYPEYVDEVFDAINSFSKGTPDVVVLVKRYIGILNELVEFKPENLVKTKNIDTLRKVYFTIDDKHIRIKILEMMSTFFEEVEKQADAPISKRDQILVLVPEIQEWVDQYTKMIKDPEVDEMHIRTFFNSLYELKREFGTNVKVDSSFLNWLADQMEKRQEHLSSDLQERDLEQDEFDRKLIDSRHKIFGNPNADSIKRFRDEL